MEKLPMLEICEYFMGKWVMKMDFSSLKRKGKSAWAWGTRAIFQTASPKRTLCSEINELFRRAKKIMKIKVWWIPFICPSRLSFHPSLTYSMLCKTDIQFNQFLCRLTAWWIKSMENTHKKPKKEEKLRFWFQGIYCPSSISVNRTVVVFIKQTSCRS